MSIPKITEKQVKSWFDSGSFSRGKSYFSGGSILQPKCQGSMLKSRCTGSYASSYRVQVAVGPNGDRVTTGCSCPLGGSCKHCVALLLQWVHQPESFNQAEELNIALLEWSKEDLVKVIGQMVDKHPELETLIEVSALSTVPPNTPIDADALERQILNLIEEGDDEEYDDYGYGDHYGTTDLSGLDVFEGVIEGYVEAKEWFNAATISMTIIETLLGSYEELFDDDGAVGEYVDGKVDNLEAVLEHLQDPQEREQVLKALFEVKVWDIDFGGIDMGYRADEIILDAINAKEKEQVIEWTRAELARASASESSSDYKRSAYGGFLISLQADTLDDETYIQLCRDSGRTHDLIERLLSLKRVEEALREAEKIEGYTILRAADQFMQHDVEEAILPLMQERAVGESGRRRTYKDWLKDRAIARKDPATAMIILRGILDSSPDLNTFKELKTLALDLREWDSLHSQIIEQLQKAENYALLTEIYIDEKNIDEALRSVELVKAPSSRFGIGNYSAYHTNPLKLRIAQAAEESHPDASIRFYLEAAERLIAARDRQNYRQAAQYLVKVRSLYQHQNQNEEWLELVQNIREQNRALRAMQDEFNQAGLES